MVINSVITGICIKINELFGNEYHIYDNNVKQGMEKPCFFINFLNGDEVRQIGLKTRSYLDTLYFDITCFAKNDNKISLNEMADKLYDLEYIKLENNVLLRANKMNSKIEDEVLHFFIDYKIFISKKGEESIKMNDYELLQGGKENG